MARIGHPAHRAKPRGPANHRAGNGARHGAAPPPRSHGPRETRVHRHRHRRGRTVRHPRERRRHARVPVHRHGLPGTRRGGLCTKRHAAPRRKRPRRSGRHGLSAGREKNDSFCLLRRIILSPTNERRRLPAVPRRGPGGIRAFYAQQIPGRAGPSALHLLHRRGRRLLRQRAAAHQQRQAAPEGRRPHGRIRQLLPL